MKLHILRPFFDSASQRDLAAGDEQDFPEKLAGMLIREKYAKAAPDGDAKALEPAGAEATAQDEQQGAAQEVGGDAGDAGQAAKAPADDAEEGEAAPDGDAKARKRKGS